MRITHITSYAYRCLLMSILSLFWAFPALSQPDAGIKTPPWLQLSLEQRTRYEQLTNPFRGNTSETERHFPLRTRLQLEIGETTRPVRFLIEFQDSRVLYREETLSSVSSNINKHDIQQAHLEFNPGNFLSGRAKSQILIGRFTMDLGKRRLVARNKMRNTTNAFDGISWTLAGDWQWRMRTFFTRPAAINPEELDASSRRYFWGVYFDSKQYPDFLIDVYYFGVHDPVNAASRQRLSTIGGRLYKLPIPGSTDYELESSFQFGKNGTQDHAAWLYHGELGFSFDTAFTPRVSVFHDYASGDSDPNDDRSGRFNTLYGARSFEYPPTGIYGPIYRSNINAPGIRIEMNPSGNLRIAAAFRILRLAQAKDAWVGSGLQDKSGNSGKSLGQNFDLNIQWKASRRLTIESGCARFFKGFYLKSLLEDPAVQDSTFFYISTEIKTKLLPI
jgi:hypothetical protein